MESFEKKLINSLIFNQKYSKGFFVYNIKSQMRYLKILCLVVLLSGITAIQATAQQQGNIVEYFGKERIETTDEGDVFHIFTNGFILEGASRGGVLFSSQDIVAWQYATNKFISPTVKTELAESFPDAELTMAWKPIEADSAQRFIGRELRNAHLYTSFEAPEERVVLLEAKGHTRVYINGLPQEGDHYDFGYTLIPFKMKKGVNEFVYTPGRFGRVTSRLVMPSKPVSFTGRDMTLPDLIIGESGTKWGAIRIINASEADLKNLVIRCVLESGETAEFATDEVMPMAVRKVKFQIPATATIQQGGKVNATLYLRDRNGRELDRTTITLEQRDASVHHERTFISNIDNSVQYYSVAPSTSSSEGQALVLTVHGASVEARNQARAYQKKDWAHIIAPTNRRPFGFNWEEWGRVDAMEVLEEARKVFQTDPHKTYLTGHSMGGHGTWYLGVTYPDMFAAIAPCASYPDIIGYGRRGNNSAMEAHPHYENIRRAANAGRVLDLKRNYLQSGIYVLHGDADVVVSVEQARMMRQVLGEFHPNFCYYEYPGGSHWYGDHSVDWFPIFDYFKWHSIPANKEVKHVEFHTASPAISASNHWVRIEQQERSWDFSNVIFDIKGDTIEGALQNVSVFSLKLSELSFDSNPVLVMDNQTIQLANGQDVILRKTDKGWKIIDRINTNEKYSLRHGGFKQAFDNRMVFVYATGGSREENECYRNKARFDAETWLYRGNGSVDVISDRDFRPTDYKDRNVILYGNATNNRAWRQLLGKAPIQVRKGEIRFGSEVFKGDDLGAYFIYPRPDSETASVGVVAGTGLTGMKATFANNYFSGITGFPDVLVFSADMLKDGIEGVKVSGFFGNDWSVINADFFK